MDQISLIKNQVKRRATVMQIGGFKPSGDITTSCFGKVNLSLPSETWPQSDGKPMHALCQINLTELPFIPETLKDIEFISIFIGPEKLPYDMVNGHNWCLRAYKKIVELKPIEQIYTESKIRSFEMKPELIEEDYPCWEDFVNLQLTNKDLKLTQEIEDSYYDVFENVSGFKIGGWPSLVQSEIYWAPFNKHPARPNYAFQVDSTEKGNWMWGDNGVGFFGRGTFENEDQWAIAWQCY